MQMDRPGAAHTVGTWAIKVVIDITGIVKGLPRQEGDGS